MEPRDLARNVTYMRTVVINFNNNSRRFMYQTNGSVVEISEQNLPQFEVQYEDAWRLKGISVDHGGNEIDIHEFIDELNKNGIDTSEYNDIFTGYSKRGCCI